MRYRRRPTVAIDESVIVRRKSDANKNDAAKMRSSHSRLGGGSFLSRRSACRGGGAADKSWVDCDRATVKRRYGRLAKFIPLFDRSLFLPPGLRITFAALSSRPPRWPLPRCRMTKPRSSLFIASRRNDPPRSCGLIGAAIAARLSARAPCRPA
jgi:hypothetical protein